MNRRFFLKQAGGVVAGLIVGSRWARAERPLLPRGLHVIPIHMIRIDDSLRVKIAGPFEELLRLSLSKYGQMAPIVITQEGILLDGFMRIDAMKALGFKTVTAFVVEAPSQAIRKTISNVLNLRD